MSYKLLKATMSVLVNRFGVKMINDVLAEIFYEQAQETDDFVFAELSESYDKINNDMLRREYGIFDE